MNAKDLGQTAAKDFLAQKTPYLGFTSSNGKLRFITSDTKTGETPFTDVNDMIAFLKWKDCFVENVATLNWFLMDIQPELVFEVPKNWRKLGQTSID